MYEILKAYETAVNEMSLEETLVCKGDLTPFVSMKNIIDLRN